MSTDTMSSLRITRLIQADRQAVWDAWTRPDQMRKWACPEPGGVQDVSSDFRVGGAFTLSMQVEGNPRGEGWARGGLGCLPRTLPGALRMSREARTPRGVRASPSKALLAP